MGTSLRSCVEVHEPIELSLWVVSGVCQEMGVLDGARVPKWKRVFFEGGGRFHWFEWRIFNRNVFDSCMER